MTLLETPRQRFYKTTQEEGIPLDPSTLEEAVLKPDEVLVGTYNFGPNDNLAWATIVVTEEQFKELKGRSNLQFFALPRNRVPDLR